MFDKISSPVLMLGIGGIGMSAIAEFLLLKGYQVLGYDRLESRLTQKLSEKGAKILYEIDLIHVNSNYTVIYTPAIGYDNPILLKAKEMDCKIYKRAEVLGLISENLNSIAVAGTHGKTTVSSMVTHILKYAGKECSAFVGGIMKNYDTNFLLGKDSNIIVLEADEFDHSFLQLRPNQLILTSLEADHLDIYKNFETLKENYIQLVNQIKPAGRLLVEQEVWNKFKNELSKNDLQINTYGLENYSDNYADLVVIDGTFTKFNYIGKDIEIDNLELSLPGKHNLKNMIAAISITVPIVFETEIIRDAVKNYLGVKRRFEIIYNSSNLAIIDDYAHHPTEISVAIDAARNLFADRELIVAFQPHLYTRTRDFAEEFGKALSAADVIFLTNIYPAREQPLPNVTCETILRYINGKETYCPINLHQLSTEIIKRIKAPSVILIMGAGDIDSIISELI